MLTVALLVQAAVLFILALSVAHLLLRIQALEAHGPTPALQDAIDTPDILRRLTEYGADDTVVLALSGKCGTCWEIAMGWSESAAKQVDVVFIGSGMDAQAVSRISATGTPTVEMTASELQGLGIHVTPMWLRLRAGSIAESIFGNQARDRVFGASTRI